VHIRKGFVTSSLIYTMAGALPMASALILLPFYVLYLPTEVYGALSICLAFSYLVQVLVTYSFDSALYIHYHELKNDQKALGTYISSSFIFILGWGVLIGTILSLSGQFLFTSIIRESKISFYPYGLIATGLGITQAIFKVHGNLLQTQEKPQTFLWSNVLSFLIIALTTIIGLKVFPETLVGPLGGRLIAGVITTAWVLWRIFSAYGFQFKSPWKQTSFSFNAYTFVYQIQQWAINYIDRFIIMFFLPLASVGTYDLAIKCLVPVELLLNGLNASVNPKIVKLIGGQTYKQSTLEINRYYYGTVSAILLVISLSVFVIPVVISLFTMPRGYSDAVQYIPYIAVIFIFKASRLYFVIPYSILKKMKTLMTLNFFTSLFRLGTLILLITRMHLYGVIISTALTFALEIALLWIFLRHHYDMKFNAFKLLIAPFLFFMFVVLVEPFWGVTYPLAVHLGYCLLCLLLLWIAYRNEIRSINFLTLIK